MAVAENWQLIQDRRVVDGLIRSGSDPQKPHQLEYVFLGEATLLRQMMAKLATRSYSLLELSEQDGSLVMVKCMPLDLPGIYRETLSHIETTQQLGIEYDGWGCATVC